MGLRPGPERVPRRATYWLASLQHPGGHAAAGHGAPIALALAVASVAIGLAIFSQRWGRPLVAVGVVLALAYWVLGEGLGGVFTGSATDPNTGPLLVLIAVSLFRLTPVTVTGAASLPSRQAPAAASVGT